MLGIVRIALRRPYTFVVLALLILIVGPLAAMRTPTDIFPDIRIPVISVVFQYTGLPPDPMSGRIVTPFERALTTTVNNIEHIEANAYTGIGVIKIFFQPSVDINTANAQVTAIAQTLLKQMPAGITPPLILNYNASTVAILQLALSGRGMSEQTLADLGFNFIRTRLITVPGAAIPGPSGGKQRQVQIDLDPVAAQARGLSGQDVANALAAQNLITPVGTQKIGAFEYAIQLNNSPVAYEDLGRLPIKIVNGATVYLRDVAQVHDGNPPQTNIVHVDGGRSVLLTVLKNGSASTLSIIAGIKDMVQELKASLPDNLEIKPIGDQSLFVSRAIDGVVIEGVVAAALTSLMILLFLGSWRSTVIIATSIPLSVLGSLALLSLIGETLNIMTLGGLALAVGILVDDATVTIENINWHLERGKSVETAILDGAAQIVTPAFVSLLCICIVFVPMFFLDGVARFLFVPMAEAVMFAMVCSFVLSRTLVPTMANYLLQPHASDDEPSETAVDEGNRLVRFQRGFAQRFERVRGGYRDALMWAMARRRAFVFGFIGFVVVSFALVPFLGRNFFPAVDGGQILIHGRAQAGTRVEETARIFADVQDAVREIVPPGDLGAIVDNIGLPTSGINMTYNNTGTIGSQDGDIQIALNAGHRPTEEYVRRLREELPRRFPGVTFSFTPADIVSQILNFGVPAPIDLQVRGANFAANFGYAQLLLNDIRRIPGIADARVQQARGMPSFDVDVDRTRAQYAGLTERDVTNSMVVNLAGSGQVSPTFWLNPQNGVQYPIVLQTPQYQLNDLTSLQAMPITAVGSASTQLLGALAQIRRSTTSAVVSQYDIQPMIQIYATTQGRDLGAVASAIHKVIDAHAQELPKGSSIRLLGQVQTMNSAFSGLLFGLLGAVVLIYLLIVVNFQSWSDPFVIVSALPAALAGIVWMLFATFTTLSVPALTGAIMCMGIATANSVLVISFARERLDESGDPIAAAIDAGFVRFRPVLMTALAMIIGMTPMALGLGEGGEQNAPLGRAVIGGLLFATVATLMFVPVLFSIVHARSARATAVSSGSDVEKVMSSDTDPRGARSRRFRNAGVGAAAVLLVVVAVGIASRVASDTRVRDWTGEQAVPTVAVVKPSTGGDAAVLDLPARLEATSRAPLYARVSGYLKEWNVDIGAKVKAGQLLARIEAPDLEDQLAQARADLATAEANAALALTTSTRWQSMLSLRAVSKQEAEEKSGDLAAKQAIVNAQRANVNRLKTLHDFTAIVAPFDGVVTARNTDVGALINVGGAVGQELFVVSDIRRLRVYVDVPQVFAAGLTRGTQASVVVPEHPGKSYAAEIEAASGAVNAATGTTLMQLSVDNADSELMPGAFATVNFTVPHDVALLRVPSSALIFDKSGLSVATLDAQDQVVLKTVTIARDHGASIEIASGLSADDRVIETPPDGLVNGMPVRVVEPNAARPVAMR